MTPELALQIIGIVGTGIVAVLAWSMRRNVQEVDAKLGRIETDVRQLSAQGARHGEALAGGVVKFSAIEKRLDKIEDKQDRFQADCIACRTSGARE